MNAALGREHGAPPRPQLWHISVRATFGALRQSPRRARRGPVSVTWLPASPAGAALHPRVAFAIGRSAGGAVVRNRIRRRLRAALRELQGDTRLPAGAYLISARTEVATMGWPELVATVDAAVASATAEAGA